MSNDSLTLFVKRTSINAIRTGFLGSEEFLVTVDDGGIVALYSLNDLKRPPVQFEYVI